jgi:hypothetical protein
MLVRVKKTRQNKDPKSGPDSIRTDQALVVRMISWLVAKAGGVVTHAPVTPSLDDMSRAKGGGSMLKRFQAKRGPAGLKKTRQNKNPKPGSDSIRTDWA